MISTILVRWLVLAAAVWATTALVPGIVVAGGIGTYLLVAAVFATVNAVLGAIVRLITLPIIFVTFGIFSLVINAWMLLVTDRLMDTFDVDGFGAAFGGAIVIAFVTLVLHAVLRTGRHQMAA